MRKNYHAFKEVGEELFRERKSQLQISIQMKVAYILAPFVMIANIQMSVVPSYTIRKRDKDREIDESYLPCVNQMLIPCIGAEHLRRY